MIAYFDSSALVKLLVDEVDSEVAASLWDGADAVLTSRVAYAEVRAALAAARRGNRLIGREFAEAKRLWGSLWDALRIVELSAGVGSQAGDLAEQHALSGFDAVHLASAMLLAGDDPVLATWDARLHKAAAATGLTPTPPALG